MKGKEGKEDKKEPKFRKKKKEPKVMKDMFTAAFPEPGNLPGTKRALNKHLMNESHFYFRIRMIPKSDDERENRFPYMIYTDHERRRLKMSPRRL